jgi:MFS family permease
MMATLVVGPFYLSRSLALTPIATGFALSTGPVVTALTGLPAGRAVDRLGSSLVIALGLGGIAVGAFVLAITPYGLGLGAYLAPIVLMTAAYASFQAANNTSVMTVAGSSHRGAVSGMLSLARNIGLMTGTTVMGAVFAFGSGPAGVTAAAPASIAAGMRVTFAAAAALMVVALAIALRTDRLVNHSSH